MTQGMESFYTREKANSGVEVPLYRPDGSKSEHHFLVRGVDSDVFRTAEAEARRKTMEIAMISDSLEKAKAIQTAKLTLIAHLVISWSFDQECTIENIVNFFREAPQIADAVDQVASKRALFFAQRSSNSETSQEPSSASTKSQKDPSSPSGTA
jgi:predicted restriction endonuclease